MKPGRSMPYSPPPAHSTAHHTFRRLLGYSMVREGILFCLIALLSTAGCDFIPSTPNQPPAFRTFSWYETLDEVKKRETAEFLRQDEGEVTTYLWYKTTVFDEPVAVFYAFDAICEQLFLAEYIFDNTLNRKKFHLILDALKNKYGPTKQSEYMDDLYLWNTADTKIDLVRQGNSKRSMGKTSIAYNTSNWHWMGGFKEGTEPDCEARRRVREKLKKEL